MVKLLSIRENDYLIPDKLNLEELIIEILNRIGNPYPILRDELIYAISGYSVFFLVTIQK